jgi:hypothetical protein
MPAAEQAPGAGLVAVAGTRHVRGGTEQLFERAAARIELGRVGAGEQNAALLHAVADEVRRADDEPLLVLRTVRLTSTQLDDLRASLSDTIRALDEADLQEPRFGVLVGVYRERQESDDDIG